MDRHALTAFDRARLLRWLARIVGTAAAAFALAAGLPNVLLGAEAGGPERFWVTAAFSGLIAGVAIGWWRELMGGLLLVAWSVPAALIIGASVPGGSPAAAVLSFPYLSSGLLFLMAAHKVAVAARRAEARRVAEEERRLVG